ncbi:CPBP family intramembrane metalloprotease domain-containing protein [Clostridium diolis]|uniref:CPBP family intramembrane glutamic endopeptidase n=1 Tax=Clostridium diolis TaxID=223919 RepID=UPI000B40003D|nr:type II CAAX endopeptidase family protein [Clostridium diolis]OVE70646.1 CPBP family intramembrane metalloprotease domain-containing protein [Clostridium diolis]
MRIFSNDRKQVRSGWKIILVFVCFFVSTTIMSVVFSNIYSAFVFMTNPALLSKQDEGISYITEQLLSMSSFPGAFLNLIQCILMIFFVVLFWKVLDRKKVKDIGLINIRKGWKDLFYGLLFGAISFTIVAIILLCTKSVELVNSFNNPNFSRTLFLQLIVFIFVGINEELFARGYCMTVLKQTKIAWIPILGSSIIFSLMHSLNHGISLLAYVNLFLFGIFMGYLFIKTKNIWMCIGYHITWNYFQGDIFGFLVSGNITDSIYTIRTINSNIVNGGSFGPEGGIVVTALLVVTILITYKFIPYRA